MLKEIIISLSQPLDGEELLDYLQGLSASGCTKVEVFQTDTRLPLYPLLVVGNSVSIKHLSPLTVSPLVDLVTVQIIGAFYSSLTNVDLLLIGSCSPRLRVFRIGASQMCKPDFFPRPTSDLGGIIRFTRILNQLEELQLSARLAPVDIETPDNIEHVSSLEKWDVGGSIVHNPKEVALALRTHFPRLLRLSASANAAHLDMDLPGGEEKRSELGELLDYFQPETELA